MKKTQRVIFISFLLFCNNTFAQITFQQTYGTAGGDYGLSARQTLDGGYIVCGSADSSGSGETDYYLVKTSSNGTMLWNKTYGGPGLDLANSVRQTNDSGYIIAGFSNSFSNGSTDLFLVKTNASGDTMWTRIYGGSGYDYGYSVEQTLDSGYIVSGATKSFGAGNGDVYLLKLNPSGDTIWTKTYGGPGYDYGNSVRQTSDSGYIIAGSTNSFGAGGNDIYVIKTNSEGDTLWSKTYGQSLEDDGSEVVQTHDGGYAIVGSTVSFGAGSRDVFLLKINSAGDTLWAKTYGGSGYDYGLSVKQTSDQGFILAGYTNSFGSGSNDIYLIRTNDTGDTLWTRIFGSSGNEEGYSVCQTSDGGFLIAGNTDAFGAGGSDIYLVKTDSNGYGCNQISTSTQVGQPSTMVAAAPWTLSFGSEIDIPLAVVGNYGSSVSICLDLGGPTSASEPLQTSVFPNPASAVINITVPESNTASFTIEITNLLGEIFKVEAQLQEDQISIDVRKFKPGIYIVKITDKNNVQVQKFIKE